MGGTSDSSAAAENWALQAVRRVTTHTLRLCIGVMIVAPVVFYFFFIGLSVPADQASVHYGIPLGAVGVFAIAAVGLAMMLQRLKNPYTHPALQWPSVGTPDQVATSIDTAVRAGEGVSEIGYVRFTPTWILSCPNAWQFQTVPISSVVWVFLELKTNTHNGIPTSQTYTVKIYSADGRLLEMSHINHTGTKEKVEAMLANIAVRAPWAVIGFSEERKKQWDKNRAAFLQAVATRRDTLERADRAPDAAALRA